MVPIGVNCVKLVTTLELLSNRQLKKLSHIRVSQVENDIKDLYKLWIKKKNGSGLILVELKQWFGDMNLNMILRMIAGKRLGVSKRPWGTSFIFWGCLWCLMLFLFLDG